MRVLLTKVVVFSRGKIVEVVDEYVYLGTTFNYNNKFRKAQVKQIQSSKKGDV